MQEKALWLPSAQRVAAAAPEDLIALGIIASRARAILALAAEVAEGRLTLHPGGDLDTTMQRLKALVADSLAHVYQIRPEVQ